MTASNQENRSKSARFTNLGHAPYLAHKSFWNRPGFPLFLPCHQSLDYALNQLSRPLSTSDRKIFSRKGRGEYCTEHPARKERRDTSTCVELACCLGTPK